LRNVLDATVHVIGYAALTGAALWVMFSYLP
jgi:hypothetical protein